MTNNDDELNPWENPEGDETAQGGANQGDEQSSQPAWDQGDASAQADHGSPGGDWGDAETDGYAQSQEYGASHQDPPPPHGQPPTSAGSASGMAIGAVIAGVVGVMASGLGLCCCLTAPVGFIAAVAAMAMAYMEYQKIETGESSEKGRVLVMVGGGLGAVSLLLNLGTLGLFVLGALL